MLKSWSRTDRLALLTLLVGLVGSIAALLVVPEIRHYAKLRSLESNPEPGPVSHPASPSPSLPQYVSSGPSPSPTTAKSQIGESLLDEPSQPGGQSSNKTIMDRPLPPVITMNNGTLEINGTIFMLPVDVREFEMIFGKASRIYTGANRIYVWDDIGIFCYGHGDTSEITQVSVALRDNGYTYFYPQTMFKGSFKVDGTAINGNSDITAVNQQKSGKPFTPSELWGAWEISYGKRRVIFDCKPKRWCELAVEYDYLVAKPSGQ